jgi:hypothetical protein
MRTQMPAMHIIAMIAAPIQTDSPQASPPSRSKARSHCQTGTTMPRARLSRLCVLSRDRDGGPFGLTLCAMFTAVAYECIGVLKNCLGAPYGGEPETRC